MTPRLKDILERRKAKADTQTESKKQGESLTDTPSIFSTSADLILQRDRFSDFF